MKVFKTLSLCVALLLGAVAYAQNVRITGTVTDAGTGEPVIGAAVIVPGTTNGTSTDLDGNFALTVPSGANLEVSCIGYTTLNVKASPVMNIRLQEDTRFLDEVVVTGYMTEKKSDLTGSVAVVKMKEVADIPRRYPGRRKDFFPHPWYDHHQQLLPAVCHRRRDDAFRHRNDHLLQ